MVCACGVEGTGPDGACVAVAAGGAAGVPFACDAVGLSGVDSFVGGGAVSADAACAGRGADCAGDAP
jgi:hypothetical protein